MFQVEEIERIGEVEAGAWDAIADQNMFAFHGWLQATEDTIVPSWSARYWLVRDADGLLAALPAQVQEPTDRAVDLDDVLLGRLASSARRLGFGAVPALVCGARMGPGAPVLLRRGLDRGVRAELAASLLGAAEERADRNGWTLCLRGVPPDSDLVAGLDRRLYVGSLEMPTTRLDVRWSSFDDYLRDLKASHPATRKNARQQVNWCERRGVVIEELADPRAQAGRLHEILDAHHWRLNGVPFPFGPGFVTALERGLGRRLLVLVARRETEILAVSLSLRNDDTVYVKMAGIDVESGEGRSEIYHNLLFYHPIRLASEGLCRRLYFGKLAYDSKVKRGAVPEDSDLYLRGRGRLHAFLLRPLFAYRARKIARSLAPYRATGTR